MDYENISLLKDDIKDAFETAGFRVRDMSGLNWFERINSQSVYVHPMFETESVPLDKLSLMVTAVEEDLASNDIPMSVDVVCHMPGGFAFKVSLA